MAAIGYRLAQESKFQDFPFTFYLIDMPEPNAFALPGGQIFITKGMLDLGLNDDMLAGLLGHEIGHVVLKHGTRIQRRATLPGIAPIFQTRSPGGGRRDGRPGRRGDLIPNRIDEVVPMDVVDGIEVEAEVHLAAA